MKATKMDGAGYLVADAATSDEWQRQDGRRGVHDERHALAQAGGARDPGQRPGPRQ